MKQLVKSRHNFSTSHIIYLRSLKNTGSALLQLATVVHHPNHHHSPPPPPPLPMSPTSEAGTTTSSTTNASTPLAPPPPPSSTWDPWDPLFMPSSARSGTVDEDAWEDTDVSTTNNINKELLDIIKELDECFLRAADSGGRVSELLEVPACGFSGQGVSGKVHGYGKNLSPLFSSNPRLNVFVKFGCDDMDGADCSLIGNSHCSTVERLYALEKKLYQEVKNVESLKIQHAKRVELLRKMKHKRADYMMIEKAKIDVEKLESKMMVSSQAIESASDEIVKRREEELYPQLVDLVKGLMDMWRNLYENHQVQMHIVQQLKYLHVTQSTDPTSEMHRQAVLQLEVEVQQWHLSFCNMIQSQRDYVQSLTGWLRLSLFQYRQTPSSQTIQDHTMYTLCEEWQRVVDKAPDSEASEGIKALLTTVHAIVVQQAEEQNQKRRLELSFKELEKKTDELRAFERKLGPFSGPSGKGPVGDKRAKVETLRLKTEEERGKYEKSIGVTKAMTFSNLQTGLPLVFQAVTGFSNVWMHGFESVYDRAKRPEEVHDVSG